jgi:tRNA(His) 5'-end guanylyltransferase
MKFTELNEKMRVYETLNDRSVLPNMYMVARLDGRNFTSLTKNNEDYKFEAPFDEKFKFLMVETTKGLMKHSGFNIIYGYTQSDEISLLFDLNEGTFNRKTRKMNSVLAGYASADFTRMLGYPGIATFDCRISELPTKELVEDYFRWRNEDAHRNALSSYCYWTLRKNGFSARKATSKIFNLNNSDKNELLFSYGINFNELPA